MEISDRFLKISRPPVSKKMSARTLIVNDPLATTKLTCTTLPGYLGKGNRDIIHNLRAVPRSGCGQIEEVHPSLPHLWTETPHSFFARFLGLKRCAFHRGVGPEQRRYGCACGLHRDCRCRFPDLRMRVLGLRVRCGFSGLWARIPGLKGAHSRIEGCTFPGMWVKTNELWMHISSVTVAYFMRAQSFTRR